MSWGFDDINCGGRLQVGTGIVPAIKEGNEEIVYSIPFLGHPLLRNDVRDMMLGDRYRY